ncbi:alpha/beta fold hydrolase [Fretibacter rubidus]|uniref:alpha/beta fold hydrolase n=1 Tax=Fretibacter rubidus TaxID=570162 RepID=UPI00352A2B7E
MSNPSVFKTLSGHRLAYHKVDGAGPTVIWCGGLKSDMEGSKALHLHSWAKDAGRAYIRFDYFGHGVSDGEFTDGTISRWAGDVLDMIDHVADGDVILVGSSMGGWASLLAATARPKRVQALVLINPAPDFTQKLTYASFSDIQREDLERDGVVYLPSDYDEPYAYSKALIDDGRARQILDAPINFDGPVRILQGMSDDVVPPEYSRRIMDVIRSEDATYTLVKGGDHSLSRPQDLALLVRSLDGLLIT